MKPKQEIFLISFLLLFLELALIRFLPSQVYYLGYYSNFILIGGFVGMGMGMVLGRAKREWLWASPWALCGIVASSSLLTVSITPDERGELHFTGDAAGWSIPEIVAVPAIFLLVCVAFLFLAQRLGRLLNGMPPLSAYTWNVAGGLAGVVAFALGSWLRTNPFIWFAFSSLLFLLIAFRPSWQWFCALIPIALTLCLVHAKTRDVTWSPYQKITLAKMFRQDGSTSGEFYGYALYVNNVFHQVMIQQPKDLGGVYAFAYEKFRTGTYKRALIIGAGSGNDVAVALAHGVEHVDAVEIDPMILGIGKRLHPMRPYQDPRVRTFIDDGRSFLERHADKYDLIIFALPDSLVLAAGNSAIRLETFLFTQECLTAARNHLRPGGLLTLYNQYRKPWLVARLKHTLDEIFGSPSLVETEGKGMYLSVIMNGEKLMDLKEGLRAMAWKQAPEPATDDWPFLYLKKRSIPQNYVTMLCTIALLMMGMLCLVTRNNPNTMVEPMYFFLGVAFLLLETKSVIQFALLFGTTWAVNALVFFAILVLVLAGIQVAARFPMRCTRPWCIALGWSLVLQYFFPLQWLQALSPVLKYSAISLVTLLPVFFANVIFSYAFGKSQDNARNLASNVLGSAVGGMLEYLAMATGYRHLTLIVMLCYAAALVKRPHGSKR